jgi:hypothetical protein
LLKGKGTVEKTWTGELQENDIHDIANMIQ